MKRYIFSLFVMCLFTNLNAQHEFGTHFMYGLNQSNLTNPAAFTRYKINVSLPSLYTGFYNSSFSLNEIFDRQGNSLYLNMDNMLEQMGNGGNSTQGNLNAETFSFSLQTRKWRVMLHHGFRMGTHLHLPKEVVQIFWGGNAQFLNENVNIAPMFNFNVYQEFGVGFAYKVSENLTLGTRLKYLVGAANIYTSNTKAMLHTNSEYYQLTAETDFMINTAGIPEADFEGGDFLDFDNFEFQPFGQNTGFALDFGANLQITDQLSVATSVLNIGKINWKENVYNYHSNGQYTFDGLDFEPLLDEGELDGQEILDTLSTTFDFQTTYNEFSSTLPNAFYLSARYELMRSLRLGALIYAQGYQSNMTNAFALNVQKDFGKYVTLGTQYALMKGSGSNIGASLAVQLGFVQLYGITDNVLPLFNPMNGQNVNLRFGLNLAFADVHKKKKLEDEVLKN